MAILHARKYVTETLKVPKITGWNCLSDFQTHLSLQILYTLISSAFDTAYLTMWSKKITETSTDQRTRNSNEIKVAVGP